MRVNLIDLESQYDRAFVADAMDLVRETVEFDLTASEDGFYHCVSKMPGYHVEMQIRPDGLVQATCHCTTFKRNKECRHALAALFLLREQLFREKRKRKKTRENKDLIDEVLKKIPVTDLRAFLSQYAHSHAGFRAEIMAHFMQLQRKPDYNSLLADLTPIDKFGKIKLNRNQIKHVRNIIAILLRQAQQLIKEKSPGEAFLIIEAVIPYLHRLILKAPVFREQLSTELKLALKLFDAMCQLPMAPRLQSSVIQFTLDTSVREGYTGIKGMRPMLQSIEPFLLEARSRQTALQIAEKKMLSDPHEVIWASLLVRWSRLWDLKITAKESKAAIEKRIPEIIQEYNRHHQYEDILYLMTQLKEEAYSPNTLHHIWHTGWRAARQVGDERMISSLGYKLCIHAFDLDALEGLLATEPTMALKTITIVDEMYTPGSDEKADDFVVHGLHRAGELTRLFGRLKAIGDIHRWVTYDYLYKDDRRTDLVSIYAQYIREIREAYGGVMARQKLSNIFGHLKSAGLYQDVTDLLKSTEQKNVTATDHTQTIKGFVFDLDGVIVDTAIHHFQSWKKIMKQLGVDIADEDDEHTRGASRMESLEYLLDRYGIQLTQEEKEMWAARKNDIYLEAIQQITPRDLLPGALPFLIDSRKAGLKLALGSASKNARGVLDKLGIADRFDAILDGNDAQASKPDPEIFTKACQALNLDPAEVVVFEDAAKGVQAAVAAGCKVVGLGDPGVLHQADIVITGLDGASPSTIIEQLS